MGHSVDKFKQVAGFIMVSVGLTAAINAEINLELNQASTGKIPIAVKASRYNNGSNVAEIVKIVSKDLGYSEKIKVLTAKKELNKAEFVVNITEKARAKDKAKHQPVFCMEMSYPFQKNFKKEGDSFCLEASGGQLRQVSHQFADKVHRHITGKGNVFTHRIGYVKESGSGKSKRYQIISSDFDRYGEQVLLESSAPIMSLSFSPNGKQLAYVSFEEGVSRIYIQEVATGSRSIIAKFQGVNSAPSWSPDGKKMAMALSFSGVTKLYIMDIQEKTLTKVTSGKSIDTEPYWVKDGSRIVFSSNRTGSPQIHEYSFKTKRISQLTHHGQYNVAPQMTSDGRFLIYLTRIDRKLQIVAQDLKTNVVRYLGNGNFDDTPRVSPTDGLILYTTAGKGVRSMLAIVSIDGVVKVPMEENGVSLKYPSWSPVSDRVH